MEIIGKVTMTRGKVGEENREKKGIMYKGPWRRTLVRALSFSAQGGWGRGEQQGGK